MTPVIRPPVRKEIRRGLRLEKSLEGETTLAATLVLRVAMSSATSAMEATTRLIEVAEQHDGVPDGLAEEHGGGGGDGDADEGVERHGGGQSEGLAPHLRLLRFGVAGEIGDVERDGGPEADHAGEGRDEEAEEFGGAVELAGRAEYGAEAAGLAGDPPEEQESDAEHERRADAFEEFDGLDAAPDDRRCSAAQKAKKQIQAPAAKLRGGGPEDLEHGEDGLAADPGLYAEPSAGNQGAQHGGDVGAANSERGAYEDRKGNAVLRARMGIEQHGDEHDQVAEQDGADGLPPAHAAGDQAAGRACRWGCRRTSPPRGRRKL